jgi:L-lactate dehydrogenase complex protein LldF
MQNEFKIRIQDALADTQLRQNFKGAMHFLQNKRELAFEGLDLESLRNRGAQIRKQTLNNLPQLLEQLEDQCIQNGIKVHWAIDAVEARTIISEIALANEVKTIVKGKSMASEEIELNQHLQKLDIECLETDMGEYIVQLDGEAPSHIIMPAIHKNKAQIAELFEEKLGKRAANGHVDELIGIGREALRTKFKDADMGVSGVNFAVAETGSLCLIENEGNGRMCTTTPNIHVAIMGIEKVIPSFKELPDLLNLLTRSATGQSITTYVNIINSARKTNEQDGPKEVHLVLLDNGRSEMFANEDMRETLACIRCGACMNHCPVYTRIGGHAYGSTYPGPIGQVVMPQIESMEDKGDLLDACSLNGACGDACPVKIELPHLIRLLRGRRMQSKHIQQLSWKLWRIMNTNAWAHKAMTLSLNLLHRLPFPSPKAWSEKRAFPKPAAKSFSQQLAKKHKND